MQGKSHKVIVCMAMILCGAFAGCETHQAAQNQTALHNRTFTQKLPAPKEVTFDANLNPFEKQFRIDTGETNLTRRSEVDQSVRIDELAKDRLLFKFELFGMAAILETLGASVGCRGSLKRDRDRWHLGVDFLPERHWCVQRVELCLQRGWHNFDG